MTELGRSFHRLPSELEGFYFLRAAELSARRILSARLGAIGPARPRYAIVTQRPHD
jgi:hypothetical protein